MPDDLSLLLQIKGENVQAKNVIAETRTAITGLRTHYGTELQNMNTVTQGVFGEIGKHLNVFVGERIPLIGGAFLRVTENVRGLGEETKKGEAELAKFEKTVGKLSDSTGKSNTQIVSFLTNFVQLESQAKRDAAAIETFGAATAQTLIPELEKAGKEFSTLAVSTEVATGSLAGFGGVAGIAALAILGMAAAATGAAIAIFELAKKTSEYGAELYKAQASTGLTAETLSTLQVIATETGTSFDSLVTAAARLQVAISKGLTTPASEAGKALKFLKLDTEDFKKSTPDDQLIKTAKAINEVTNQADKNRASLALTSRGFRESAEALKELAEKGDEARKKADEFGLSMSQGDIEAAHKFEVALKDIGLVIEGLSLRIGSQLIPQILGLMNDVSAALFSNKKSWTDWGNFIGDGLARVVGEVRVQVALIIASITSIPAAIATAYATGDFTAGVSAYLNSLIAAGRKQRFQNLIVDSVQGGMGKPTPTAPAFPGKAAKDTSARDAFEDAFGQLKDQISEREAAYAEETADLKHQYDERLVDFEKYIADEKIANAKREKDVLLQIAAQRLAVEQAFADGVIKKKEADQKTREIDKDADKIKRERRKADEQLDEEYYKHALALAQKYYNEIEALTKKKEADEIADLQRGLEITLEDYRLSYLQRVELIEKFNEAAEAIRLRAIEREEQHLTDEVRQIALHYAEIHKVSIEEAFASQTVIDASKERAQQIEALEYERSRVIKATSDANIDAYKREATAARPVIEGGGHLPNAPIIKGIAGAIQQLRQGIEDNFSGTKQTAALAGIDALSGAFEGLGQAIGQVVQAWVLYGNAGTSVRKMTAEILASIAQQAAVKAVFELAEGFAALAMAFLGIPNQGLSAGAHFQAAAIYGSVAGIAAVAGRGVAGNSFAQSSGSSGGGGTAGTGGGSSSSANAPINLGSQRGPAVPHIIIEVKAGPTFDTRIVGAFAKDMSGGGASRQLIVKEINRQS